MSDDERLEWFPCKPGPLLGALAGMSAPEQHVYLIVLLRIYENGGACPDTLSALSLRTRLNKRVVSEALDSLFRAERLYRGEGGIRNPKADKVISHSWAVLEKQKIGGAEGGKRAAQNRKKNQQMPARSPVDQPQARSTHLHLQEQDSLFSIENRVPPQPELEQPIAAKPKSDDGWPEDHLEQFWKAFPSYRLAGKAKVGEKLARLRRDKTVTWEALISGVRRYAATNPGEYASGPMPWLNGAKWDGLYGNNQNGGGTHGENRDNRGPRLGAAGIAAKLRQSIAERERADRDSETFFAAGDHEPSDGSGHPAPCLGAMDRSRQAAATPPSSGTFGAGGPRSP